MWLHVCHSPVVVCLSLGMLRHFSSESVYCLRAHNRLSVSLAYSPPLVNLSHSPCLFFLCVHLLLFLCLFVSAAALLSVWIPLLHLAAVGMTPHCLCYRILTGRIVSDSSHCLSPCVWLWVCVCVCMCVCVRAFVCVCVLIWHSQRSSPDFSRLLVQPRVSFQLAILVCLQEYLSACLCVCDAFMCPLVDNVSTVSSPLTE